MNKRLLMLSGLAILAVVMNHASQSGFVAMFWWTDRYRAVTVPNYDQMGSLSYYGLVAMQKLALFSVPSFLFITGMFLSYAARGSQSRLTWAVVFRRILNLLPPYLIWSAVYYGLAYALGTRHTPVEYLLGFFTIEYSVFFFVPLIIVYYLLSPFLSDLAKNRPIVLIATGVTVLLAGMITGYLHLYSKIGGIESGYLTTQASYLPERKIFEYFFYYALGLAAGFYQLQLKTFITKYRWVLLGVAAAAGVAAIAEAEWVYQATADVSWRSRTMTLPTVIYAISFILAFLAFDTIRLPKFFYQLGVDTLGIYMIHQVVLMVLPKIIYHILPFLLGIQVFYQPLLIIISIGAPVLLMLLTRRLPIKNHSRILFG
jgi:hypothetical protein